MSTKKIKLHEFIEKYGRMNVVRELYVSPATVSYWSNYLVHPRPHHIEKLQKLSGGQIDIEQALRVYLSKKSKIL